MRALAPLLWCVLVVGAGCVGRPPIAEELDRFATTVSEYPLDDGTRRSLVEAYQAHVMHVRCADAEYLLGELYKTGLDGPELAQGFGLSAAAQVGTGTARGTGRIVLATSLQAPSAQQLLHVLRARKAASEAKSGESVAVEGTAWLHAANYGVEDVIGFLEGLPLATSAGNPKAGWTMYLYMRNLPLLADARVAIQSAAVAAAARKVDLPTFGEFMRALALAKLPTTEVVAYCNFLARSGSEHVTLQGLLSGYDAVEDLPLRSERRLELFEGAVAALAHEAHPDDVRDSLAALAASGVGPGTLDALATQILRALASFPSEHVAAAVARALAEPGDDAQRAERLAAELSRVAAAGRRRPILR